MEKTRRILLIGEGHGFEAALESLKISNLKFDVLRTEKIAKLPPKCEVVDSIEHWIQSSEDLIISSAYRKIIDSKLLKRAEFINIHYALFPKYRGMHSIVWAILNGEKKVGVTIHQMNDLVDGGNIIFQHEIDVLDNTSWELMEICDSWVTSNLDDVLRKYLRNELLPYPQDESQATYVARRNINDCKVNWSEWNVESFSRHLRALVAPYPLPFFIFKGLKYEILDALAEEKDYIERNGKVVYINGTTVYIKISGGILILKKLRAENGQIFNAVDVLSRTGISLI